MARRSQLDATTSANRETDLVVTLRAIPREAEQPCQKRAGAPARTPESAGKPVVNGDPPSHRRQEWSSGHAHPGLLVREQPFEPQAVMHRDVEDATHAVAPSRSTGWFVTRSKKPPPKR
jgi:hypothetical protein